MTRDADRGPCRVALAHPDACGRTVPRRHLFCGACWPLVPRPRRVELERLRRTDRGAWVALIRQLVDELAEARRMRAPPPGKKRAKEFVEPEERVRHDGVSTCPRCMGHKHTSEFHLLEPGDQDPRGYQFEKRARLEESLVWFTYPPCTLCDSKGVVSTSKAAHWAKVQNQRREAEREARQSLTELVDETLAKEPVE